MEREQRSHTDHPAHPWRWCPGTEIARLGRSTWIGPSAEFLVPRRPQAGRFMLASVLVLAGMADVDLLGHDGGIRPVEPRNIVVRAQIRQRPGGLTTRQGDLCLVGPPWPGQVATRCGCGTWPPASRSASPSVVVGQLQRNKSFTAYCLSKPRCARLSRSRRATQLTVRLEQRLDD